MILYIENPKDATRKLLELINEFGKVAGYKINAQKSLVFLYINNKISEKEIFKNPIHDSIKNVIKYLGINSSKEVKDLYTENYTTLLKEDMNNAKTSHVHGLEELKYMLKCPYYLKQYTGLMQSLSKFQWHFPQK